MNWISPSSGKPIKVNPVYKVYFEHIVWQCHVIQKCLNTYYYVVKGLWLCLWELWHFVINTTPQWSATTPINRVKVLSPVAMSRLKFPYNVSSIPLSQNLKRKKLICLNNIVHSPQLKNTSALFQSKQSIWPNPHKANAIR